MTPPPFDPKSIAAQTMARLDAKPRPPSRAQIEAELARCEADVFYFIDHYVQIYDNIQTQQWVPFKLWADQRNALRIIMVGKYIVVMKARQLGLTWIVLGYILWLMRFVPIAEWLCFSQRDDEAQELLNRLRGMYDRLPDWMKLPALKSNTEEFQIENGSRVQSSTAKAGGRSYAATGILTDEGDFIENLSRLVNAAKATIDMGENKMIIISTVNPDTPNSYYQRLFQGAVKGENSWTPIFIPWFAHPQRYKVSLTLQSVEQESISFHVSTGDVRDLALEYSKFPVRLYNTVRNNYRTLAAAQNGDGYRTDGSVRAGRIETELAADNWQPGDVVIDALWNDAQERDALTNDGTLDKKYKEYPATPEEALALPSLNVRFYPAWLQACYAPRKPLPVPVGGSVDLTKLPGLKIYAYPEQSRRYGIGADPAGGKSDGDDAVANVVDAVTKQQVAVLAGKIEPTQFAEYIAVLHLYYNNAPVLFELNNHGHAVRAKLKELGVTLKMGETKHGPSRNPGWLTTDWSKAKVYDTAASVIQQEIKEAAEANTAVHPIVCDPVTYAQLCVIDAQTLSAPERMHDDYATAWVLSLQCVHQSFSNMEKVQHDLWPGAMGAHEDMPPYLKPLQPRGDNPRAQNAEQDYQRSYDHRLRRRGR